MLLGWQGLALVRQQTQRPYDMDPGVRRRDHRVDVSAIGGYVWVGQGVLVLGDLLRAHSLDSRMVVVEYNRRILRDRAAYDSLELADGGSVEIVHFVGGG